MAREPAGEGALGREGFAAGFGKTAAGLALAGAQLGTLPPRAQPRASSPDADSESFSEEETADEAGGSALTLRLFLALGIGCASRERIGAALSRLRAEHEAGAEGVKWVDPSLMHFTLKFLGSVEQDGLQQLRGALPAVTSSCAGPFPLTLTRGGIFWQKKRQKIPRVLFVSVEDEDEGRPHFVELAKAVDKACVELGFAKEKKKATPHVTVGRARRRAKGKGATPELALLGQALEELRLEEPLHEEVREVSLMKSVLTPQGPQYTVLDTFPLLAQGQP